MSIIDRARDALENIKPELWRTRKVPRPENGWGEPAWEIDAIGIYVCDGEAMSAELIIEDADAELIAAAPEVAAELVRLHDELSALADELDEQADENHPLSDYFDGNYYWSARIRQALEGEKQ